MTQRKISKKFYFSVEGHTEKRYLQWLEQAINDSQDASNKVSFSCKIESNPEKYVKTLSVIDKTEVYHIFDYESSDQMHSAEFQRVIDCMKKAQGLGKQIQYKLGYSNLTFELWLILHKADCFGSRVSRKQYLSLLNNAFDANFMSLEDFKNEKNFTSVLHKLTIDDVKEAISRARYDAPIE